MEELEHSTLDLIRRRRAGTFYPVYVLFILLVLTGISLPLVEVELVTPARGMIRPAEPPVPIISLLTGTIAEYRMADNQVVKQGDTLVVFRKEELPEQLKEAESLLNEIRCQILDIHDILCGGKATRTSIYIQAQLAHNSHSEPLSINLSLKKEALRIAEVLYSQEVIPTREYDLVQSEFLMARASFISEHESFRTRLETELSDLEIEKRSMATRLVTLRANLNRHCMQSPSNGILYKCAGFKKGSVVAEGTMLGMLSQKTALVAECYTETRHMAYVKPGSLMKIRMDGDGGKPPVEFTVPVWKTDPDITILESNAMLRVVCKLDREICEKGGSEGYTLRPGMTLSANLVFDKVSIWNLLLGKLREFGDPYWAGKVN